MMRFKLCAGFWVVAVASILAVGAAPLDAEAISLLSQDGPLPITVTIAPDFSGPAILMVSGSVWAKKNATEIGFKIAIDGVTVGRAKIFSNAPNTHRAVVSEYIPVTLDKEWKADGSGDPTPASYTLTLQPLNTPSISDENDNYSVALIH